MNAVPLLKKKVLEEKMTVALDKGTMNELRNLKALHGVDTMEWFRGLIRQELPKLKKAVGA